MPAKKKVKQYSTTIVPKELKGKLLSAYIVDRRGLLIGVYRDNTARVLVRGPKETEEQGIYFAVGNNKLEKEEDISVFSKTASQFLAILQSEETRHYELTKEEGVCLADKWGVPTGIRYKRSVKRYHHKNGLSFIHWDDSDRFFFHCPDDINILSLITDQPMIPLNIKMVDVRTDNVPEWTLALLDAVTEETHLSCDLETYDPEEMCGDSGLVPWNGRIRTMQIYAPKKGIVTVFDFGTRKENRGYPPEWADTLYNMIRDKKLIWHNALFDMGFMHYQWGLDFWYSHIFCTQVMSTNLWAGIMNIPHNLGAVAKRCGLVIDKGLQTSDFGTPLTNGQWIYGANDTIITWKAYEWMLKELRESPHMTNLPFAALDCSFLHVCHMIRIGGMHLDYSLIDRAATVTSWHYGEQAELWMEGSGLKANPYYKDLVEFLKGRGHNVLVKDPKKRGQMKESSNKAILKEAAKTDPLLQTLLEVRSSAKLLDFITSLGNMSKVHKGRAICGIKALANQGLGRTSSSAVFRGKTKQATTANLQNIPTKNYEFPVLPNLRECFVAHKGYVYVGIDLSSAHLRFAAHFSGAVKILAKMKPGEDVHVYHASLIIKGVKGPHHPLASYELFRDLKMGKDVTVPADWALDELMTIVKMYRDISKTAIYTAINLGGAARLQAALKDVGIIVTLEEAKAIMEALWKGIPEIKQYVYALSAMAANHDFHFSGDEYKMRGAATDEDEEEDEEDDKEESSDNYICGYGLLTAENGRSRYLPKFKSKKYADRAAKPKVNDVASFAWMSREADMMKEAGVRFLREYLLPNQLLGRVWVSNYVHDEYVLLAEEALAEDAGAALGAIMQEEWTKICPSVAGVEGEPKDWIGRAWSDIH